MLYYATATEERVLILNYLWHENKLFVIIASDVEDDAIQKQWL